MNLAPIELERFLTSSTKVPTEDLDWAEARRAGLTPDERTILTYFSDIEGQTIIYTRELLNTKASEDPEIMAFLTMWNYEEFFHGRVLSRILEETGTALGSDRVVQVRRKSLWSENFLAFLSTLFSKLAPDCFITLYMTWGAINELTTLRGYEAIHSMTGNPILQTLCDRIAKQERRHFAWYFNRARERLEKSSRTQKAVRLLLEKAWSPVGAGVKSDEEVRRLLDLVFPGPRVSEMAEDVDRQISTLPGLQGIGLMQRYLAAPA